MLGSPKMNEYLGVIAPEGKKGLYMGYANMPAAIGWAYGSFIGGQIYERVGEKAGLALRYLSEVLRVNGTAGPLPSLRGLNGAFGPDPGPGDAALVGGATIPARSGRPLPSPAS